MYKHFGYVQYSKGARGHTPSPISERIYTRTILGQPLMAAQVGGETTVFVNVK